MQRVYLENNAVNRAIDSGWSGSNLRNALVASEYDPVIGWKVVYETCKEFVTYSVGRTHVCPAKARCRFIHELAPCVVALTPMVLQQEYQRFKGNSHVSVFLEGRELDLARAEISRLARGHFTAKARRFITEWESGMQVDRQERYQILIDESLEASSMHPAEMKELLKTFADRKSYLLHLAPQFPKLVQESLSYRGISVPMGEAGEIAARIVEFPCLRASLIANCLMCRIPHVGRSLPAEDKVHDYHHVIDASYCDILVTDDRGMQKDAAVINPNLSVCSFDDLVGASSRPR